MTPKTPIYALILACFFSLFGTASRADASALALAMEYLPTVVVGPPRSIDYPQPLCSVCKLLAERETTANGQLQGSLYIRYEDERLASFEGSIEVTVLLPNRTRYVETFFDVQLDPGDELTLTLPNRAEFSWGDVELLWVELVPAAQ